MGRIPLKVNNFLSAIEVKVHVWQFNLAEVQAQLAKVQAQLPEVQAQLTEVQAQWQAVTGN